MPSLFFHNFSGRNLPDYSREDFNTMHVVDGFIVQTGMQLPCQGGETISVDLGGATVFAAFADAHVHFTQTGITLLGCRLENARSLADILDMVSSATKKNNFVLGWNMQETRLAEKRLPTLAELDRTGKDAFIWLARADLHSAVANTKALQWARSFFPDIDPQNALISGERYNFLSYELNRLLPADLKKKALELAATECFKNGVGTVHALEGSENSTEETIAAADFFATSPLHGVIYHQSPHADLPKRMNWNKMGGCLLIDGSLGTRTAALHQNYTDSSSNGCQYLNSEAIDSILKTATHNGMQLALHAIGDRAIDAATACYARAALEFGKPALPHRLEHCILPTAQALADARKAETQICVQPAFDYFWGGATNLYAQRLGAERALRCNPFKTILLAGLKMAGGSDSPVTPINPLLGIHALVNHCNPDERLDLNTALAMFIAEPHTFAGEENLRGHLRSTKSADFVCLTEDPFAVPRAKLKDLQIRSLYLGGKKVY